jgi:hypothetical protein
MYSKVIRVKGRKVVKVCKFSVRKDVVRKDVVRKDVV